MKKIIPFFLLIQSLISYSQISTGELPVSYYLKDFKSTSEINSFNLKELDTKKLLQEDLQDPSMYRMAVNEAVSINIKESGVADPVNGGQLWRYAVKSPNALSLQLEFSTFYIPLGAKLFIYNSDYSKVFGAFTKQNVTDDSTFVVALFPDNELIIEYFEPSDVEFKGVVRLGYIGQAYKEMSSLASEADSLYININCREGKDWQNEKHAVCLFSFREGKSTYICSGSLINNSANDGTPYFLTANHCVSTNTVAGTVVAYFNFEKIGCDGETQSAQTLSGATLLSTGSESDYSLLQLKSLPPASYKPFYAGWTLVDYSSNSAGIHHPEGLEKKISFSNDSAFTYPYEINWNDGNTTPANTHWYVFFNKGQVAGGSSGSPLFNPDKKIIGQLHGGDSLNSFYGKLNYSWENNNTGFNTLLYYLAKGNTSIMELPAYSPSNVSPDAYFYSDYNSVCPGAAITLYDYSAFIEQSRLWSITPASYSFHNQTSDSSQFPLISFDEPGTYTIGLTSTNTNGSDYVEYTSYIVSGSQLNLNYSSLPESGSCLCNADTLEISGNGAFSYVWGLDSSSSKYYTVFAADSNKVSLARIIGVEMDSTYLLNLMLYGRMSECFDSTEVIIQLVAQQNDLIENATPINLGISGPFSNKCATVKVSEPVPPYTSCTSQSSWCDEYGNGENLVENSVWFTVDGPETGILGIKSNGMDGQIAIYDAASASDIMNGNYTIVAANDDYSNSDFNAIIKGAIVESGKKYWLQFDGSGGGTEGDFTLEIFDNVISATHETEVENAVSVFPNPTNGLLNFSFIEENNSKGIINIYSISGILIYQQRIDDAIITVDLSNYPSGLYLYSVTKSDKQFTGKFEIK
jgi:hypothetical protein